MDIFKKPEGLISVASATTTIGAIYYYNNKSKEIQTQIDKLCSGFNKLAEITAPVKGINNKIEDLNDNIKTCFDDIKQLKKMFQQIDSIKRTQEAIITALANSSPPIIIPSVVPSKSKKNKKQAKPVKTPKKEETKKSKKNKKKEETESEEEDVSEISAHETSSEVESNSETDSDDDGATSLIGSVAKKKRN